MTSVAESPSHVRKAGLHEAPRREWTVAFATVLCGALLAWGWSLREELYWSAEYGLGYALGIIGLGCLVALLSYPLRKRQRSLHGWGKLAPWFRVHMLLGILGPTAILFHANFQWGSINSSVALLAMLGVAGSGYIGRFIYSRIHRGLFGERRALAELMNDAEEGFGAVERVMEAAPELADELRSFEGWALERRLGFAKSTHRFLMVGARARKLQRRAKVALKDSKSSELWFLEGALVEHLEAAQRVARFSSYERLFSLWHAIHLPLCFVLFGAAAVHVLAVHMF